MIWPVATWTAIGVPDYPLILQDRVVEKQIYSVAPQHMFKGFYLLVTTPGWQILEARVGNRGFLFNVDGAAYSVAEHDRLERIGQLERHRLEMPTAEVGTLIAFSVRPHYPKIAGERDFQAVIVGREVR